MKPLPLIAYYSAEYAIDDNLPIFAGGLGVLAADLALQAGAEGRSWIAFGIAYRHAMAAKNQTDGQAARTLERAGFSRLAGRAGKPFSTIVDFGDWAVEVGAWERQIGSARLVLIDANLPDNSELNRHLTSNLYDPDTVTRLLQEFILAYTSLEVLKVLGQVPDFYHLNEGHMGFVPLLLAARYREEHGPLPLAEALERVRPRVVGTKHTILGGAGDFADLTTLNKLFGHYLARLDWKVTEMLAVGAKASDPTLFSTTAFMLNTAARANAVSRLHAAAERAAHVHSQLIPITNGVYRKRWQAENLQGDLADLSDDELWGRHQANRRHLVTDINRQLHGRLDPERLTVVWARRFAPYKRPTLVFEDLARLQDMMTAEPGFQLIISGNANEVDEEGMRVLEEIVGYAQDPHFEGRLVYLPHYAPDMARRLVQGADVWLNTPIRGMEACGTSGMKASLNGALNLSISDGWIDEIDLSKCGWELPENDTAEGLYDLLENLVAPLFYDRDDNELPYGWVQRMRAGMELTERQFTTGRLLRDYYAQLYNSAT